MVDLQRLPREVRDRFRGQLQDTCERPQEQWLLRLWGDDPGKGSFFLELRRYAQASLLETPCAGSHALGSHRGFPLEATRNGRVRVKLRDTHIEGPDTLVRFVADRVLGIGDSVHATSSELYRAAAVWRPQFEPEPMVAMWFRRSQRIERFWKPLYPSPPVRGGLVFVRTGGFLIFRMHLVFSDTATAEKAVHQTRDGIIAAMHSGLYPRMDWQALLQPLTVHPEGSVLWVQWSLPETRAFKLLGMF